MKKRVVITLSWEFLQNALRAQDHSLDQSWLVEISVDESKELVLVWEKGE